MEADENVRDGGSGKKPPSGPLSKALLPWFITGLCRRIKITWHPRILKVVAKISSEPSLGRLVKQLHLESWGSSSQQPSVSRAEIGRFFNSLVNLTELDVSRIEGEIFEYLRENPSSISPANFPSLDCLRIHDDFCHFGLTSFQGLRSLHIGRSTSESSQQFSLDQLPELPHLVYLSIENVAVDGSRSPPCLSSLCPQLSQVRLDFWCATMQQILPLLPSRLKRLEIVSSEDESLSARNPCDHLLSRFTLLEHLSVGSFTFSPNLPSHISQLTSLCSLEIGHGNISIDQFFLLVSGPTRLPRLEKLKLDLLFTWSEDFADASREEECDDWSAYWYVGPEEGLWTPGGWVVPEFDESIGFTREGIKELIEVAMEQGIEVKERMDGEFKCYDEWLLCVSNMAIYRCYREKTFHHLRLLRDDYLELCGQLPTLDLDHLDPNNLGIVATVHPDLEYRALTLTDRAEADKSYRLEIEELKQQYGDDWWSYY
ncbi:hypothetical protein JCM5350_001650 [Sporobolomyces pararoseus]